MSRNSPYREDPLSYRISYARIAQELHAWSTVEFELESPERQPIPAARVRDAIAAVQREVPMPRRMALSDQQFGLDRGAKEGLAEQARALVDESRDELLRLGHRWVGRRQSRFERLRGRLRSAADSRLAVFLACVVEPATVAIYFSARVEEGWNADFTELPMEVEPVDRRPNAWSDKAPDSWLRPYLERIRMADAGISYRARYNLACLFSRSSWQCHTEERSPQPYLAEATRQLELCVAEVSGRRRSAIQGWAWRDPAFTGLKEFAWREFSRILGPQPEID